MDSFYPKPIGIKIVSDILQSEAVTESTRELDAAELDKKPAARVAPSGVNVVDSDPTEIASSEFTRKRPSSLDFGSGDQTDSKLATGRSLKRPRANSVDRQSAVPVCLMATDRPTNTSSEVLTHLESHGWKVVVVHDGADALRLLQMRNWDAVLVDDDLPGLSGTLCMSKFREWEDENRVNRQKNTFLVSDLDIPSPLDRSAVVQAPSGFDHVLPKPVAWADLRMLLHRSEVSIVVKK